MDNRFTLYLQGDNSHPVLDYVVESIALGTPVVEFGWTFYHWRPEQTSRDLASGILAVKAWAVNAVAVGLLKYTLDRKRPDRVYQPRLWNTRITPSFPSGHAASSAVIATVAAGFYPKLTVPAAVYTFASAYSQVYVGNHYVGDVLAGTFLGILVAKLLLSRNEAVLSHSGDSSAQVTLLSLSVSVALPLGGNR